MGSLEERIAAAWPVERWRDLTVVVAVSGGADSVALLRALAALRAPGEGRLIAAHVNHGLRSGAADEDECFVARLCGSLDLPCDVARVLPSELAERSGDGLEAALRDARYRLLTEAAQARGARYLVTAHTADDQAETILHHVLRGTGLAGLSGMSPFRPLTPAVTLARPLLAVRRAEVVAYLRGLGQAWRDDATNAEPRFTRNRIRHDLIPRLAADYNENAVDAVLRLGQQAREAQEAIAPIVEQLFAQSVHLENGAATIDCTKLRGVHRHILRELFVAIWRKLDWPRQAMGFEEWDWLAGLANSAAGLLPAESARRSLPSNIAAWRVNEQIRVVGRT